jgi:amidase
MSMSRNEVTRRSVLGAALGGAVAAGLGANHSVAVGAPAAPFELEEATVADLQAAMASGRLTSKAITEKYLQRIEALNRRGPDLRHIIETNPEAQKIAEQLDEERRAKGVRGPLHGVPVLVKDNIDTADRMTTTAGSLALEGHVAAQDAFLVARLRSAGAVILGKANLSEWSNFRSHRTSSGWSARGGQAKNPYALDRNPSGSSSGSAGAVSANLCPIAVGTETNGSIVSPSSCCGVVGIKPTVGLISRSGIIPISSSQDTAGPIARTVADAATLLGALTGVDPNDNATKASDGQAETDYTKHLRGNGLKGARIGIFRADGFHPNVLAILEKAIATIKSAGATVIDPVEVPTIGKFGDAQSQVLRYEFKATLNAYLGALGLDAKVRCLEDVIAFNEKHRELEMPFFDQEILLQSQKMDGLESPAYQKARDDARKLSRDEGLHAALDAHELDSLVALTNGPAHLTDLIHGDRGTGGTASLCAAAGCPSITVPAGNVHGLPVGISFMGRAFAEGKLIQLAYAFEQVAKARKPPQFLSTLDLRR